MPEFKRVEGKDLGELKLYTLSTCGWCKKTKAFLNEHGVAYSYCDVDLLSDEDMEAAVKEQKKYNPLGSFPTMISGNRLKMVGYDLDVLKQLVGEA
jgi:glutaredoxin-like protein NrdH